MFKKRAANKKATNIEEQVDSINQTAVENANENGSFNKNGNGVHHKVIAIENYEDMDNGGNAVLQEIDDFSKKEEEKRELEECFAEYRLYQKQSEKLKAEDKDHSNEQASNYSSKGEFEEQHDQNHERQSSQIFQPEMMINQILIEDEEGDMLELVEDYGDLSPEEEHSEDYEQGYQNDIIKRTLSKQNYHKIKESLTQAHSSNKKHKLLQQLQKISFSSVQRKIAKDLRDRKSKRDELKNEVQYLNAKIKKRLSEVKLKQAAKQQIQQNFSKYQRMLEFLYYYGDEVKSFDEQKLMMQVEQAYNEVRLIRIRQRRLKEKEKFEERRKKKRGIVEPTIKMKPEQEYDQDDDCMMVEDN